MSQLLVCPPDYFTVDYEINPWMRLSNTVQTDRARIQWQRLIKELEQIEGMLVKRMTPVPGLPDLVFTANAGVVCKEQVVISHFKHPERQREEPYFEQWFRENGYQITTLERGLYFEGAGDLLGFSDVWYGGYRQRSDIRAYAILSEIFRQKIIPLELVDSKFYHLDTCFCPLSGGELLYYPAAFDSYGQVVIKDQIREDRRLIVSDLEAMKFACNAICVGKHVVLPEGCPHTVKQLQERGYETHPVPLDEFMKSGGSAKCLTLALD